MRRNRIALSIVAVATAVVVAGCAERASLTAPERHAGQEQALLGGLLGSVSSLLIPPLERNTPLAQDISWSFTVGPSGAVSSNAASGLTITVPAYAVASATTITVTALAGDAVAYRFAPHGLQFARKVYLTQNLQGTSAGGLLSLPLISGAYFGTDSLVVDSDGLVSVLEVVPASVSLLTKKATFPIEHFSGWIYGTGRGSRDGSATSGQ